MGYSLKLSRLAVLMGILVLAPNTHAQTRPPELLMTWRANTYAPADFSGKILPIANSHITASFELVDRGKAVDVSRETVYWYVNDDLVSNKPGMEQVAFRVPEFPGRTIDLRVELPGYGGGLLKTIEIPVVRPEAVVDSPLVNGVLKTLSAQLRGLPYFFNVQSPLDLSFFWNVNGVAPDNAGDPTSLTVNLPQGTASGGEVEASLTVQNAKDTLETGAGSAKFNYIP